MTTRNLPPEAIEKESFAIIEKELGGRTFPEEEAPVVKRVIHTTADFSYADTLYFSPDAVRYAKEALRSGALVVTDTQMALAGVSKRTLERFGGRAMCFMSDPEVAAEAKKRGVTRARVSMERAASLGENVVFAIGNAPTALIRLRELIDEGYRPKCIIAVPVGFVNVVDSKEMILESPVPCIVARGRKGGSNVAAAIVNALLYEMDESRGGTLPEGSPDRCTKDGGEIRSETAPKIYRNSDSFFQNRACAYFPCHKTDDPASFNCLFCYCPLYMLGDQCGGNFRYTAKGIKDCTFCTVPHRPEAAAYIRSRFAEIADKAGLRPQGWPSGVSGEGADADSMPAGGMKDADAQIRAWAESILPPDEEAMERARARWDGIAKPLHGLGKLEDLIVRIAGVTGDERVSLKKRAAAVFCADNGVVAEGVTQTDSSVTQIMAGRIAARASSVCLMAETVRADVYAADIGMLQRVDGVRDVHVKDGTENMAEGPAMTKDEALLALRHGVMLAKELAAAGYRILIPGEMGIGNTTTASAVTAVLLGLPADEVTGRGAGLNDAGLCRKRAVIKRAIAVNRPDPEDALDVLSKIGGLDLAGMAGLFIGAAVCRVPAVIDGLPAAAAALAAARLVPGCVCAMLPSHVSAEPAARHILDALQLSPLLYADMKLGEGTGAVCLLPLLDMALAVYDHAVKFEETGIAQYTPQGGEGTERRESPAQEGTQP
ncbi:MAG: nicotinate-nucleotide--dimethylbenzimidazole phosphoribosyltransferase [Lachnospiraceae bacterium]|nr:nicotinate-nucleotide--dimethylbenzimidazole phosphoribosyltransferase [Lachnospiraceae bacterium]